MKIKTIEIRDRATFIPALAVRMDPMGPEKDFYLIHSAGHPMTPPYSILLVRLTDGTGSFDPFAQTSGRTMRDAHIWLTEHFDEIESGYVLDVEFINDETKQPKQSQRMG